MKIVGFLRKICIVFICISLVWAVGCGGSTGSETAGAEAENTVSAPDIVEVDAGEAERTKLEFTKEELLADYDTLWAILDENYIYVPFLESQGIDIESIRENTRQQLENRVTDVDGFYYLLDRMFREMRYFAHLGMVDAVLFEGYQKYYNAENSAETAYQKCLQNPQSQAVYAYLREDASILGADTGGFPEVEASYDAQRKAVTFVIVSFDDSLLERDANFISDYLALLGDAEIEHIIFDISGNGGGNDLYWMDNIVAPFGGTYEWSHWLYLRDTELTRAYFSDWGPEPVSSMTDHALPDFVEELGLTQFIHQEDRLSSEAMLREDVLTARRWVIIDGGVYSSADSFSAFCKQTGWATLVGQTTAGDGKGISPVLVSLPNTGLLVRFSGVAAESPDGTLSAISGIAPDIPVNPSIESARDAVNRLIAP